MPSMLHIPGLKLDENMPSQVKEVDLAYLEFTQYMIMQLLKKNRTHTKRSINANFIFFSPIIELLADIYNIETPKMRKMLLRFNETYQPNKKTSFKMWQKVIQ